MLQLSLRGSFIYPHIFKHDPLPLIKLQQPVLQTLSISIKDYEMPWGLQQVGLVICQSLTSVQFSSVAQSCPTLCDPMSYGTPGLPVHHQLLEFTQTRVHRFGDTIQPSHPLLSPSPPAPNPSQHHSPLSKGFSRQEYWSRLPCFPPGDLPDPGTEPVCLPSSALADGFFIISVNWKLTNAYF